MAKHLGIIIAFGPEVRGFVHSGLISNIAQKYRITIITAKPESASLYGINGSVDIIQLPENQEHSLLRKWRQRAALVHTLWLEKLGFEKWHHYLNDRKPHKSLKQFILFSISQRWTAHFLGRFEAKLAKIIGNNRSWSKLYHDLGIDAVLTSSYASERTLPALATAVNMGLKTFVVTNSWKDIHVKPHLPLQPTRLMVWNQGNAALFVKFNPWMKIESLQITGSLHLGPFLNEKNILSQEDFCQKTGLSPNRPYICYSAAAPHAVQEEEGVVAAILEAIKNGKLPRTTQMLLRFNPMEDGSRFEYLRSSYPEELVIQKPQWEWLPELDWCCALPDDVRLWVSTVHYARVNVSIPSTVTLEFAALKKPVLNVCFDMSPQEPEQSNLRFWNGDFYQEIKSMDIAKPCFSEEELLTNLQGILAEKDNQSYNQFNHKESLDWLGWVAAEKIKNAIEEAFDK